MWARRGCPVAECHRRGVRCGSGGVAKMGLWDWAVPRMDRWPGRRERRACLGMICPLLISVAARLMATVWLWMARRYAEGERETVMLVGLGEMCGS